MALPSLPLLPSPPPAKPISHVNKPTWLPVALRLGRGCTQCNPLFGERPSQTYIRWAFPYPPPKNTYGGAHSSLSQPMGICRSPTLWKQWSHCPSPTYGKQWSHSPSPTTGINAIYLGVDFNWTRSLASFVPLDQTDTLPMARESYTSSTLGNRSST